MIDDPAHAAKRRELSAAFDRWIRETADFVPAKLAPDEFDRETGAPLPNRVRPRLPLNPDRTF